MLGTLPAVTWDEIIVGHQPKNISGACTLFLLRGSEIVCTVVGRHSTDLDHVKQIGKGSSTPR